MVGNGVMTKAAKKLWAPPSKAPAVHCLSKLLNGVGGGSGFNLAVAAAMVMVRACPPMSPCSSKFGRDYLDSFLAILAYSPYLLPFPGDTYTLSYTLW